MSVWIAIWIEAAAILGLAFMLVLVNKRVTTLAVAISQGDSDGEEPPYGDGEPNGGSHFGADQS